MPPSTKLAATMGSASHDTVSEHLQGLTPAPRLFGTGRASGSPPEVVVVAKTQAPSGDAPAAPALEEGGRAR